MDGKLTVVLDVGKTMSKLSLWSVAGQMVARETRANDRIDVGPYIALDADGIEAWLAETLTEFVKIGRICAIIPVSHGAAAAVLRDGKLAVPPIDYEEPMADGDRAAYAMGRSRFDETGSPSLPDGLNLGAQFHRLERLHPGLFAGNEIILPWAQYWAWLLSGVAASEVTSLGCHTDLWNPGTSAPSTMSINRGWASLFAPLRSADGQLGVVRQEWVDRCGLPADVAVYCGLHDSNAALLAARGFPEIADHESTVLSTGTWFVAMRTPEDDRLLDLSMLSDARDCLINVDAYGKLVPSARFMGGREIELLTGLDTRRIDIKPDQPALVGAVGAALRSGARVLPTFAPGFGPFASMRGQWIGMPTDESERRAAVSLYAALVTNESLNLIGARERILVEGRFAEAEVFVRAVATLRPNDVIYRSNAHNDVSYGALRLLNPSLRPASALERVKPLEGDLAGYRDLWRRDVERIGLAA